MTGKNPNNNPEVPTEPWYVVKERQVEWDRKFYDGGLASLTDAIREERMKNGYFIWAALSTNAIGLKMRVLQGALVQLSRWHSECLAELAKF